MATQLPTQQDILDSLQDDHECYLKLINRLNDEEQQTPFTPEGWSQWGPNCPPEEGSPVDYAQA